MCIFNGMFTQLALHLSQQSIVTVLTRCKSTDRRALLFALFAALFITVQLESWTIIILYMFLNRGRPNMSHLIKRPTFKAVWYICFTFAAAAVAAVKSVFPKKWLMPHKRRHHDHASDQISRTIRVLHIMETPDTNTCREMD